MLCSSSTWEEVNLVKRFPKSREDLPEVYWGSGEHPSLGERVNFQMNESQESRRRFDERDTGLVQ